MELRKRGKEDVQQSKLSAKDPTKDAKFSKLTDVKTEINSGHVITECFLWRHDTSGLIIRCKFRQNFTKEFWRIIVKVEASNRTPVKTRFRFPFTFCAFRFRPITYA